MGGGHSGENIISLKLGQNAKEKNWRIKESACRLKKNNTSWEKKLITESLENKPKVSILLEYREKEKELKTMRGKISLETRKSI